MTSRLERWSVISLGLLALASGAWFGLLEANTRAAVAGHAKRAALPPSDPAFPVPAPGEEVPPWEPPPLAVRGSAWTFDLFSSPEILVDRKSGRCRVRGDGDAAAPEARRDPECPLGLLGYFGTGRGTRVVLELVDTHRIVTVSVGERIGDGDWRVAYLEAGEEGNRGFAVALVHPDGREVRLAADQPRDFEPPER